MTRKKGYGKFIRLTWLTFGGAVLGIISIFSAASFGLLGPMPDFRQLENPKTNLATQIISADDTVLGKFYLMTIELPLHLAKFPLK